MRLSMLALTRQLTAIQVSGLETNGVSLLFLCLFSLVNYLQSLNAMLAGQSVKSSAIVRK
jgi:hypothetical protein